MTGPRRGDPRVSRERGVIGPEKSYLRQEASTFGEGSQVVKGFRAVERSIMQQHFFFPPFPLRTDSFTDLGCARACVCVTTWDANVSETYRTWLEIIMCVCATTWKCKYVEGCVRDEGIRAT